MYLINDKISAVRQIQRYLGINESGIYDNQTRNAVTDYQSKNGINPTGSVDYATFISLRGFHINEQIKKEARQLFPFEADFPYKRGDFGEDVGVINNMLSKAIEKYYLSINKPRGDYYSVRTEKAVVELRKIFLIDNGKEVDEIFYEKLHRQ